MATNQALEPSRDKFNFATYEVKILVSSIIKETRSMRTRILWILAIMIAVTAAPLAVVYAQTKDETPASKPEATKAEEFKPEQQASKGSVTVGGNIMNYDAFAGT